MTSITEQNNLGDLLKYEAPNRYSRDVATIAAGKTEADVRRVLIDARAAQSDAADIRSTITVDAGTQNLDRPETSPIVAAVKKLTAQA